MKLCRGARADYPLYADHRISHDRDGLTLARHPSGEIVGRLVWSEVRRATAFKRDLVTTDLACIEFELASGSFEINEEIPGWQGLVDLLDQYLPGARPYAEWWPEVVKPPFEARKTPIFAHKAGHAA
jgi:hypothetical protein